MPVKESPMTVKRAPSVLAFLSLAVLALSAVPAAAQNMVLDNGRLKAEFNDHGLVSLAAPKTGRKVMFSADPSSVTIDGAAIDIGGLGPAEIEMTPAKVAYRYARDPYTFDVIYELKPARDFLTKQIAVTSARSGVFRVQEVRALAASLGLPVADELRLSGGAFGALCRFAPRDAPSVPAWGLFVMLQNPFMAWTREGREVAVSYAPDMDWSRDDGPFASDRLCLGLYELSGTRFPAKAVPEGKFVADYDALLKGSPTIDANEVNALTDCVRAFLLYYPVRSVRVHIPWCENDYQIDVGTPEGVEEYKRIMDRAAELGITHLLYTPANSGLSRLEDNADSWGWENVLWFGLGQKLRKGEWDPRRDAVPEGLKAMLDYAASKRLKLMAYAYPSLPFLQNPEWTAWAGADAAGGRAVADTGLRSFQDWWLNKLLGFMRTTGAAGFSFDHWWIALDKASSKYAQWFGCRRILESLRREAFDAVVDGRQQYQNFGPWTWLGGSYPHPTLTDEQPESFKAFPDLHTDRVSADRQRFAAWTYRVERFAPPEIMPGFITHQSELSDDKGVMRRDRFRPKDWDVLGWKYSLISSIGTAPFHHVVNFIPARDPEEFAALSDEDKAWFRKWLDWTDENARFLHALRPIIGPPMVGRVDGTAAIVEDRGIVFLFNPNPGRKEARFRLDASIGLLKGERLMIKELYPEEGRLVGSAEGLWAYGGEVVLPLPGREAAVYEVFPAPAEIAEPILFNVRGEVSMRSTRLVLTNVTAEAGRARQVLVLLPKDARVRALSVNGVGYPYKSDAGRVTTNVRFAGRAFSRSQSVGDVPAGFAGGTFKGRVSIPAGVFAQLAERKKSWPVSYTDDDLLAPWLGAWRLLLHIPIAEATDALDVSLKINGKPVEVRKAYNSVYPHSPGRTFIGHYADVSWLKPGTAYDIEVVLPPLEPGRFQGVFFENVETEYTRRIMAPPAGGERQGAELPERPILARRSGSEPR
jgi:hypothetical protein